MNDKYPNCGAVSQSIGEAKLWACGAYRFVGDGEVYESYTCLANQRDQLRAENARLRERCEALEREAFEMSPKPAPKFKAGDAVRYYVDDRYRYGTVASNGKVVWLEDGAIDVYSPDEFTSPDDLALAVCLDKTGTVPLFEGDVVRWFVPGGWCDDTVKPGGDYTDCLLIRRKGAV